MLQVLKNYFIEKDEKKAKIKVAFWILLALFCGGLCDFINSNSQQYIAQYTLYQAALIAGIPGVNAPTLPATSGYFNLWWGLVWNLTWLGLIWFSLFMVAWFARQAHFKSNTAYGLFLAALLCLGMAIWSIIFSVLVYQYWYNANFLDFINATVDWLPPMAGLSIYDFSGNPVNKIAFSYGVGVELIIVLIILGVVLLYYAARFERLAKRKGVEMK